MNEKTKLILPPHLAEQIAKDESTEAFKKADEVWTEMNEAVISAIITVATVAWSMAANEHEREQVTQHTAIALTFVRQTKIVCEMMIPPMPKVGIIEAISKGMASEIGPHDAWLRKTLPETSVQRAEVLHAGGPFVDEQKS